MLVKGQVRMVRRRVGGGYFTVVTPPEGASPTKRVVFRSGSCTSPSATRA